MSSVSSLLNLDWGKRESIGGDGESGGSYARACVDKNAVWHVDSHVHECVHMSRCVCMPVRTWQLHHCMVCLQRQFIF